MAHKAGKDRLGFWSIWRHDVSIWLLAALIGLGVFAGVSWMVNSIRPDVDNMDVNGTLYTFARYFLWMIVAVAVIIARRSLGVGTWVIAAICILWFIPQGYYTIAIGLYPNSVLQALVAMIGLLSFGRLVEYFQLKVVYRLDQPTLTASAIVGYVFILLIAVLLTVVPYDWVASVFSM